MPEHDRPVRAAAGKQSLVDRMPRHARSLLLVSPERLNLLAQVPQVEQLQQVVPRRRYQPVSVLVPLQIHHRRFVRVALKTEEQVKKVYTQKNINGGDCLSERRDYLLNKKRDLI